jgi:Spy/CpxP family protein refolding chaperone
MKRYIVAALAAALLASGPWVRVVRAQDDGPPSSDQPDQSAQSDQGEQPEHPRENGMASRMKERLGLTDEQSSKFRDAMKAHGAALKKQGELMRDDLKKLHEDVRSKASDDDLLADLAALKSARKAMAEENEKLQDALAAILTPTQQAKLALGMARMMNQRRQGMRGRMRGGRDRGGDEGGGDGGSGGDQGGPQGNDDGGR